MRTVEKAFDSPYRSLRLWGVMSFEIRSDYREAWQALVPKLVNMLNDAERECRVVHASRRAGGKAQIAVEFSAADADFWLPRGNN